MIYERTVMAQLGFITPGSLGNGLAGVHPAVTYETWREIVRLFVVVRPVCQSLGQLFQLCPVLFQLLHLDEHLAPEPEVTHTVFGSDVIRTFLTSTGIHAL